MPTPKKSKPKAGKPNVSALDSKQRELQERENEIQAKIAELQRKIDEAPARATEKRQGSSEVLFQASPRKYLLGASTLDARYVDAPIVGRPRPLKGRKKRAVLRAERRAAWVQTIAIALVLAFAICWVISHPPDFTLLLQWLHLN